MRFLVDECTEPAVARWLVSQNHEVFSVYDVSPGMKDGDILRQAVVENRIIITNDKDFGDMIYRERRPHCGVIFLRLDDERTPAKIDALRRLLADHADQLFERYVVVTEARVRFAKV